MSVVHNIIWNKCKKCGFLQHSSHLRCIKCKSEDFDMVKAEGNPKLISYTILKAPPAEFRDKASYALGIVEFENGVKGLGQITTQNNLKTGMKMKPFYRKICNNLDGKEVYNFTFEPI
ncbi:MAG TPA: OB-fold domain-containing protein [Candidatus Nanopelagicaceae bacterium]|nr:OB-fold domain-containing protein [Candidatus Nanopelagicaceae bacterium]